MVRLSTSLVFLAALTMGFTSPLVKRDDVKVLQDMDCITNQFKDFQDLVFSLSDSSDENDANNLHNMAVGITASFDQAGFDAAETGEFTPTSSSQAVQSLVRMEANMLASLYGLIIMKPCVVHLGYAEQIEKDITQMHAKSTLFANTVRADLPSYLQDNWQSVEATIERMFSETTIAYSSM